MLATWPPPIVRVYRVSPEQNNMLSSIRAAAGHFMRCATSILFAALLALIVSTASTPISADTYPSKPVRIIVPYGAGELPTSPCGLWRMTSASVSVSNFL